MKKYILILVLSILFLIFILFFYKVYLLQKDYFNNKNKPVEVIEENPTQVETSNPSVYKDYTKEDYDKALAEKRVLVLFFTSNWCQECLSQDFLNQEVFGELDNKGVVGLRLHVLDSETTIESDAVAKKFDVTKESSFVILDKNGVVYEKLVGSTTKGDLNKVILDAGGGV